MSDYDEMEPEPRIKVDHEDCFKINNSKNTVTLRYRKRIEPGRYEPQKLVLDLVRHTICAKCGRMTSAWFKRPEELPGGFQDAFLKPWHTNREGWTLLETPGYMAAIAHGDHTFIKSKNLTDTNDCEETTEITVWLQKSSKVGDFEPAITITPQPECKLPRRPTKEEDGTEGTNSYPDPLPEPKNISHLRQQPLFDDLELYA
jgi:hypothetical protein